MKKPKTEWVVIEDWGDDEDWKTNDIAFGPFKTRKAAEEKAEAENYHSASIVKMIDGKRKEKARS